VQHIDSVGCSGVTDIPSGLLNAKRAEAVAALLALCRDLLPSEPDKAPRMEIEQEIAEIEQRLERLRNSVGSAWARISD
jgi:hypothetical protein